MGMIHQEVKHSNNVKSVGYDPHTKELQITFKRGNYNPITYSFKDVPPEHYTGLATAHSAGSYFNEHIKDKYKYKKL